MSSPHPTTLKTYASRASLHPNPTARRLLGIMERKRSNLCVSVDVTTCSEALDIVKTVGGSVCMVKVGNHNIARFLLIGEGRRIAISSRILPWLSPRNW